MVKTKAKTKTWPVLQSCKRKSYEANDRLSPLPDDLLFIIMSFLTIKDVARMSVLSHRWSSLWRLVPVLVFEYLPAKERRALHFSNPELESQERLCFLKWIDQVVDAHRGPYVDDFRVAFGLRQIFQSYMDKWLCFAIAKQVKQLELNFRPPYFSMDNNMLVNWRMSLDVPQNLSFFKSCLRSLSLAYVNITTKDVDCLLCMCMVLEKLCIVSSPTLKYVRAFPEQLKHLELSSCDRLKAIDILAPNLLSFKYLGRKCVKLHIRSAPMLSNLSFGVNSGGDFITSFFGSQSKHFPQLEYLSLNMYMFACAPLSISAQYNIGINNPPAMKNLKHLKLNVSALCDDSLLGWAELIEASPLLERLTLIVTSSNGNPKRKIKKRNGRPLKSLKTLELRYFYKTLGLPIDLEFFTYVVENSCMLKDVVVQLGHWESALSHNVKVCDQVAKLKQIVPQGVNFTLT